MRGHCAVPAAHLGACSKPALQREVEAQREGALSEIFQSVVKEAALWILKLPMPHSQSVCSKMGYIENHIAIFTFEESSHLKSISQVIFSPKVMGHLDEKGDGEENCLD